MCVCRSGVDAGVLGNCMKKSGGAEKCVRSMEMTDMKKTWMRAVVWWAEGQTVSLFFMVMIRLTDEAREELLWTMMFPDGSVIKV